MRNESKRRLVKLGRVSKETRASVFGALPELNSDILRYTI